MAMIADRIPSDPNHSFPNPSREDEAPRTCPYCQSILRKWVTPAESTWGEGVQYVCFNDECSYFVRGWNWMWEQYRSKSSYRYRVDAQTGESGPLPVWSKDALKN